MGFLKKNRNLLLIFAVIFFLCCLGGDVEGFKPADYIMANGKYWKHDEATGGGIKPQALPFSATQYPRLRKFSLKYCPRCQRNCQKYVPEQQRKKISKEGRRQSRYHRIRECQIDKRRCFNDCSKKMERMGKVEAKKAKKTKIRWNMAG